MRIGGEPVGGRFRIERLVGVGGMGTVYRALDLETNEPVALKVVLTSGSPDLDRFARESRILGEMRHEHVVRWVAQGTTDDGAPFLAMEWLEGENLAQRLAREPLTPLESVQLATRVASALGAAHELGVIHRDIKPANIFLPGGSVDEVRVLDFGIARSSRDTGMTRTGAVLGTIGYMAPEQLRGDRDIGPRADVFALGCVLFECLTQRPAFASAHAMASVIKILLEDAPRVRDLVPALAPALDDLVARMLARDSAQRVASCAELVALLRAVELGAAAALPTTSRATLTATEQRVVSVIIAAAAFARPRAPPTAPGALHVTDLSPLSPPIQTAPTARAASDELPAPASRATPHRNALSAAVEPFGASLETPTDSLVVALLAGEATPAEQAARAAGCALAMRPLLPDVPMVLVTGLCVVSDRLPLGPIVDRAVTELASAPGEGIRVDALTASLVADRFAVTKTEHGLVLTGTRDAPIVGDGVRTLLGQPSLYVGRERELATLRAVFDECAGDEVSRAVIVTAPPGMGKSRLLRELLAGVRAGDSGALIFAGQGDAVAPGAAFGILGRAIRSAASVLDGDSIDAKRTRLAQFVERHLPTAERGAVIPYIGELAGVPFDDADDPTLRTARTSPSAMGDRLEHAWLRWLEAASNAAPILLVLEDLHWGDATTVRYVDRALDVLTHRPFMVLASGRPELSDLFPSLWKTRARTEIVLARLTKRASERLVRAVLKEDVSAERIAHLVERADGNAFFLEELLRYAADGRDDTLPTSMIGMVHLRLSELDSDTRRLLRAASIIGETFWAGSVAHLTGERPAAVAVRIDSLVTRELVSRQPTSSFAGDQQLTFRHALVREVAYATLTDEDRRLGHRLAAEWLEANGARDAAMLATHFEQGGDHVRAAIWYARAADAAFEVNDLDGAILRAQQGLACSPLPDVETSLRFVEGRARRWKGELDAAIRDLEWAFDGLPPGTSPWFTAGAELVNAVARQGAMDLAVTVTSTMLATPCAAPLDGTTRTVSLSRAAHLLAFPRLHPLAQSALRAAQDEVLASRISDPLAVGQLRSAEWAYAMATGSYAEALRATRAASLAFASVGDRRLVTAECASVVFSLLVLGLFAEAIAPAETGIEEAKRLGLHMSVALIQNCLGMALYGAGDIERAHRELTASAEWLAPRSPLESGPRAFLGLVALARGALDEAEAHALRAIDRARDLGPGLVCLARVKLARGDTPAAARVATEALDAIGVTPGLANVDALVRRTFIEVHDALGDHEAADRQAAIACERIHACAERIDDPAWKAAFLAMPDPSVILARGR